MISRSTDIRAALRSRRAQPRRHNSQRGFVINPYSYSKGLSGRYWRVLFPAYTGYVAAREIEFRTVVSAVTTAGHEQATGGTPISNGQWYSRGGNNLQPARAFDGTFAATGPDDAWSTDAVYGVVDFYIGYDFGVGNSITCVQLAVCGRGSQSFDAYPSTSYLQYSSNGSTWTTAREFSAATWGAMVDTAFNLYAVP